MRFLVDRASQDRTGVKLIGYSLTVTAFVLAAMPLNAETLIYKTVAGDGSVEFTDQAKPDAVIITPSPLNVVDAPTNQPQPGIPDPAAATPVQDSAGSNDQSLSELTVQGITNVSISSPVNQETLIDHEGPLWIAIQTSPAKSIPAGLTAEVLLNGKLVVTGSSDRLPLDVPERGSHQVQVKIVDQKGQVAAESATHEIHVKKRVTRNAK